MRHLADQQFKLYSFIVPKQSVMRKEIMAMMFGFFLSFNGNVAFGSSNLKGIGEKGVDGNLKNFIQKVELENEIPSGLLQAIAKVESGYRPYAINVAGRPVIAKNIIQATAVIEEALSSGIQNIDIGVMQINYRWHGEKFQSYRAMLNPKTNIEYAAQLLAGLYRQHGSWHKAMRYYHSANSVHHRKYSRKITIEWLKYV